MCLGHTVSLCFNLGVGTNRASALCTRVGAQLVKALGAHMLVVLLHILLPVQIITAVVAVEAIGHGGGEVTPRTCEKRKFRQWTSTLPTNLGIVPLYATWGQCCLLKH